MFRTSLFALAASAITLPAFAAETRVSYNPADLDDPAKVAALYAELEAAAYKVCRKELRYSPFRNHRIDDCAADALARAVDSSGLPELAAYAAGEPAARDYAAAQ